MRTLLSGGCVVNVFTGELLRQDVLMEDGRIVGLGDYAGEAADAVEDVTGCVLCPGFIDGHIHIESTMLTPAELARMCLVHGTTAIVADPHEMANVCGVPGIRYMLEASEGLPMQVYIVLPSCVPATPFDESGANLSAEDLAPLYAHPRVIGLAEMMNFPGVLSRDPEVMKKLAGAAARGLCCDGHAPGLRGKALDAYLAAGVESDHERTDPEEAKECLRKGMWVMIREGTAARNLEALIDLFDDPWCGRCLLVTDDKHPADLAETGHIDHIIRRAAALGKSPITGIRMATLQAAQYFGLRHVGAVAPGYRADVLVLEDLESLSVRDVYAAGIKVVDRGQVCDIPQPPVDEKLSEIVRNSFHLEPLTAEDFRIEPVEGLCRLIGVLPGEIYTEEIHERVDFSQNGGIDTGRDILKLAVIERHAGSGHRGLGFVRGVGLKRGAIASSVSHDSHNIIVIGTNDADMALAAMRVCEGGGNCVVADGEVLAEMQLPVGGLMSDAAGGEVARQNEAVRRAVEALGVAEGIEPFMNMAFLSLTVIPNLKMTPQGLFDVTRMARCGLEVR
ncbi:MAG: adenine deaminase [Clostridia bacterium]|nr:adenine deaminase [Clostridia bacterium]